MVAMVIVAVVVLEVDSGDNRNSEGETKAILDS
jgi:hypothetical protein